MPTDADTADLRRLANSRDRADAQPRADLRDADARTAQRWSTSARSGRAAAGARVRGRPDARLHSERARLRLGAPDGVLTGGARDAPARHQDLRTAIVWSHDLLSEAERAAFRRLSVFAAGWTSQPPRPCARSPTSSTRSSRSSTRAWSRQPGAEEFESRFTMLFSLREYAAEQLVSMTRWPPLGPHTRPWFALSGGEWEATIGTDEEDTGRSWRHRCDPTSRPHGRRSGTRARSRRFVWLVTVLCLVLVQPGGPTDARAGARGARRLPRRDRVCADARAAALLAAGVWRRPGPT